MSKIKVKEIKDPQTKVKINDGDHRIAEIKSSLLSFNCQPELAQVEVLEMWDGLPENN